jgi:hypothetical protein
MGTRHLYWILPGPSFSVQELTESRDAMCMGCCVAKGNENSGTLNSEIVRHVRSQTVSEAR